MLSCRVPLSEILAEIGWNVPPSQWTEQQVMTVIEVVVTHWQERPPF